LLDELPGKASEEKAVLFLRQLAFPHQYQLVTCPSPVSCELQLSGTSQLVGLCILFVLVVVVQFEYFKCLQGGMMN
jgi:hypothetical protein